MWTGSNNVEENMNCQKYLYRQGLISCTHIFQEVLWDLGGLSGARLPFNDEDLVLVDGS